MSLGRVLIPQVDLKTRQRQTLIKLVQGWVALGVAVLLTGLFPALELETYDTIVSQYRFLPLRLANFYPGYTGLHRSITLIGVTSGHQGSSADPVLAAINALQSHGAAATCWITDAHLTRNKRRDQAASPVFVTGAYTQQRSSVGGSVPFILRKDEHDGSMRGFYLALKNNGDQVGLRPCLPLVLYARFIETTETAPVVEGQNLRLGSRLIPVSEDEAGYWMPLIPYHSHLRTKLMGMQAEDSFVADAMEPIELSTLQMADHPLFTRKTFGRFFFIGDYGMQALGERPTPAGPFRDFQIAAMALDNLIQGPQVRVVDGWQQALAYLAISSYLTLWLLSPASFAGRLLRLGLVAAGLYVCSIAALAAGYYLSLTPIYVYSVMLSIWMVARVWLLTLTYLRRYGGSSAVRLLMAGQAELDHDEAEERVATIVFVGLPDHLRQLEIQEAPHMLDHRHIFSDQVARITARYDGLVHDFQADYLMLGFGTQPSHPDREHVAKAFQAACELVQVRSQLAKAWGLEGGDPGARVQVSVNTGLVAVGWVGTEQHKRASAAIGDTTNVAARLLGTAKKMDLDLVVAESATLRLQGEAEFESLPPVMLKGKSEAVKIYKLADSP